MKKDDKQKIMIAIILISFVLIFIPDPVDVLTAGFPVIESFVTLITSRLYFKTL